MKNCLPIVEVNEDNFFDVLPAMKAAIEEASFIAIDCELTGLGDRKKLNYPEIDLRYKYTAETAKHFAIISLGISCFTCRSVSNVKLTSDDDEGEQFRSHDYLVQTFDIITLCSDEFSVEVKAHKFLLSHGFDFNKLYAKGHQYYRGCDRPEIGTPCVREVFSAILEHQKPVVIHNGLVDLMFLYQSFYADLPKKPDTFAADLNDMFPKGVYDTKYIYEYHQSMPATYLEYLYKKMQLKNARQGKTGDWHVRVQFPPYPQSLVNIAWQPYIQILLYNAKTDDDGLELCESFAFHGWCSKLNNCPNSHNINKIVKSLQPVGAKKRGDSKYSGPVTESVVQTINHALKSTEKDQIKPSLNTEEPPTKKLKTSYTVKGDEIKEANGVHEEEGDKTEFLQRAGGHRAGFDAFMTGFLLATHISNLGELTSKDDSFTAESLGLLEHVNKIYLMGKNFPFLIRTGTYANVSQNHLTKIAKIRKEVR